MKSGALLPVLGLVIGCSSSWKDTGERGPWCAPDTRAQVFYRTVEGWEGPQRSELAYINKSGVKKSNLSFGHELDEYFSKCMFIKQWLESGTINSTRQHESPFDLCLVSMDPTVIMGVERQDPKVSALDSPVTKGTFWVGSTHLVHSIQVRTTLPYHAGAKVVWFSPTEDSDLHQIDLGAGKASFTIGKTAQIDITVEPALLTTSRK